MLFPDALARRFGEVVISLIAPGVAQFSTASNGADNGGAGLRKIGISYADVAKVANEGELFLLVRDKISQMSSASERSCVYSVS